MQNIASEQPPLVISVPDIPTTCWDEKDYCMTSEVLSVLSPSGDKIGSAIGLKIHVLFRRNGNESLGESLQDLSARFFALDKWDEYARRTPDSNRWIKFSRCDNVTDIAHMQGLPADSYYQYMSYKVIGPASISIDLIGSYVYKQLPAVQGSLLTGVSQLITDVSSMPVPSGVIRQVKGIIWHWAVCNITELKFEGDEYLVFTVETQVMPTIQVLPFTLIKPLERVYLAILGGMLDVRW